MILKENIGFVQFLSINQHCSLLEDSILCEIYILLELDCIVKSALNHVNLNLAKTANYQQKLKKLLIDNLHSVSGLPLPQAPLTTRPALLQTYIPIDFVMAGHI